MSQQVKPNQLLLDNLIESKHKAVAEAYRKGLKSRLRVMNKGDRKKLVQTAMKDRITLADLQLIKGLILTDNADNSDKRNKL